MSPRIRLPVLALAAALAACERPVPTANEETAPLPSVVSPSARSAIERAAMDRLARRLALALADPAFRAALKAELERSPFVEHKLQLQSFLRASNRRALKEVAKLSGTAESAVEADANQAIPLEIYFPVPAHRATWSGGPGLLVASAREDHEAPVAYDVSGRRQVLSPDAPPATPVLAVVPVETDFSPAGQAAPMECTTCGGGGGGGTPTPPAGLYMKYSHFVQDFEGLRDKPLGQFHPFNDPSSGHGDCIRRAICQGGTS
jgi:hypothetical protein